MTPELLNPFNFRFLFYKLKAPVVGSRRDADEEIEWCLGMRTRLPTGCMEGLDPIASRQDPQAQVPPRLSSRSSLGEGRRGPHPVLGARADPGASLGPDDPSSLAVPVERWYKGASPEGSGPVWSPVLSHREPGPRFQWVPGWPRVPCPLLGAGAGGGPRGG